MTRADSAEMRIEMIVNERVRDYINSLDVGLEQELYALEQKAVEEGVPIIRRESQQLIRFLMRTRKPKHILEIGTAVGFSSLLMGRYAPWAELITIEKVEMRLRHARENLAAEGNIILAVGDAQDVLEFMCRESERTPEEMCCRGISYSYTEFESEFGSICGKSFDFIFLDAAKAQYMSYLPYILKLLTPGGMLLTDNVLLEGKIADSKYSIERRDRTVHMRMRDFLYEITHTRELETVVLPVADGMAVSVKERA